MTTTHFRCHIPTDQEDCGHIGPKEEFETAEGHRCPKCASEHVFPYRIFRCEECEETGELDDLTGETSAIDLDPVEEGWDSLTCKCGSGRIIQVDHADHSIILGRLPVDEEEPPTVPELFADWLDDYEEVRLARARANESKEALREVLRPLIDTAVEMVNKEHPGNFHIAEVDFEVLSKKQVLVRIISLKHADTMEDVPAKSFLHDAEMPWLERMQTIISESMDLGESFPFVCGIDVKYIYVGK